MFLKITAIKKPRQNETTFCRNLNDCLILFNCFYGSQLNITSYAPCLKPNTRIGIVTNIL